MDDDQAAAGAPGHADGVGQGPLAGGGAVETDDDTVPEGGIAGLARLVRRFQVRQGIGDLLAVGGFGDLVTGHRYLGEECPLRRERRLAAERSRGRIVRESTSQALAPRVRRVPPPAQAPPPGGPGPATGAAAGAAFREHARAGPSTQCLLVGGVPRLAGPGPAGARGRPGGRARWAGRPAPRRTPGGAGPERREGGGRRAGAARRGGARRAHTRVGGALRTTA